MKLHRALNLALAIAGIGAVGGCDAGTTTTVLDPGEYRPCDWCKTGEVCSSRTKTCAVPCASACTGGLVCSPSDDSCHSPCDGACSSGERCDTSGGMPGLCVDGNLPTSWGADGKNGNVQRIVGVSVSASGCDILGDGVARNAVRQWLHVPGGSHYSDWTGGVYTREDTTILFDPGKADAQTGLFTMAYYTGDVAGSFSDCDIGESGCACTIRPESFDLAQCSSAGCPPIGYSTDAQIDGGHFSAHTDGFPVMFFTNVFILHVPIRQAHVTAQWAGLYGGNSLQAGRVCGLVQESDVRKALYRVLGNTAEMQSWLQRVLSNQKDVDTNGDGKLDAWSIALDFNTVPAKIVGYALHHN